MEERKSRATRILIIDDDPIMQRLSSVSLKKHGYEIFMASDGQEGLDLAEKVKPHLIILDVMMPKMSGWEVIKILRARPELAAIPVIFLTALDSSNSRIEGFLLGADDYLPKPFLPAELDRRVSNALKLQERLREETPSQPKGPPSLNGALSQLSLPSVLTLLGMERKSGVLKVSSVNGQETAQIFIKESFVVATRLPGNAALKNEEIVYYLLRWTDGQFEFHVDDFVAQMPEEMRSPISFLLLEGARISDESSSPP